MTALKPSTGYRDPCQPGGAQTDCDAPSDPAQRRVVKQPASNLSLPRSPLIGRDHEIAAIQQLLLQDQVGLLTLTGPGGIGKTRLAMQVAANLLDYFVDGVYFVSLAPIGEPDLVSTPIAQTLGLREVAGCPLQESLHDYLRAKQLLLVLDNFEQILAAAPLVSVLLSKCRRLKVLVTSRVPLHLYGEQEFPVPPLGLPDTKQLTTLENDPMASQTTFAAIDLFCQRARAVKPDFVLTATNAAAVAQICIGLDGLPLALELAAARIKLFPPSVLLARLNQRLTLLTGGPYDLPTRQRTMRDEIAWSYDLLTPDEQTLFRRLAVFVGGGTMEAAQAVGNADGDLRADVLDKVAALVDKSLLLPIAQENSELRYTMLETIREYGLECLEASSEAKVVRQAHAEYYLALAEEAEPKLMSAGQAVWLDRLDIEHANLRAAQRWVLDKANAEMALRLCGALWRFWTIRGYLSERKRWAEEALTIADRNGSPLGMLLDLTVESEEQSKLQNAKPKANVLAKALNAAGILTYYTGDPRRAEALYQESLNLYRQLGDQSSIATTLNRLAEVMRFGGNYISARAMYQESLAIYHALDDRWGVASTSMYLGHAIFLQGNPTEAHLLVEESLAIFRVLEVRWDIANALILLGKLTRVKGDYATANLLNKEALAISKDLDDSRGMAKALGQLADVAFAERNYAIALSLYKEGLLIARDMGDTWLLPDHLLGIAWVVARDQPTRAVCLFAAVKALREAINSPLTESEHTDNERNLAVARGGLDETTFRTVWHAGQAMMWEEAIQYALDIPEILASTAYSELTPSSSGYSAGLTVREVEVLRLLAQRLTYTEIADKLIISRRTVNGHVTSIYSKLGITTRGRRRPILRWSTTWYKTILYPEASKSGDGAIAPSPLFDLPVLSHA